MEFNNVNSNVENVVTKIFNLFVCLFFKVVKIEFIMKLQSFFCLEFSKVPTKHDFFYLSLHLLGWNESKLPMFIKIYTIRCSFLFSLKK